MLTLVTGATGHLGANLVRLLAAQGRRVRVIVRPSSDSRPLDGVPCERVVADLRDRRSLALATRGCTRVFHMAALNKLTSRHPEEIIEAAVTGTKNLIRCCMDAGVERVVYTSTAATMGRTENWTHLLTEKDYATCSSVPYVQGKIEAEAWVLKVHDETKFPVVVVNPTAVLGPYDYRLTPVTRLVARFLSSPLIPVLPGGLNVVDSRDVAAGHVLAESFGQAGERYLLAGSNVVYRDLLRQLVSIAKISRLLIPVPRWMITGASQILELPWHLIGRRPPVSRHMVRELTRGSVLCDATKARDRLGFQPRPMAETLQDTVAWLSRLARH